MPKNKKDKEEKKNAEPVTSSKEQNASSSQGSDVAQPQTEKVAKEEV